MSTSKAADVAVALLNVALRRDFVVTQRKASHPKVPAGTKTGKARREIRVDNHLILEELAAMGKPWLCPGPDERRARHDRDRNAGSCRPCRDAVYQQKKRAWDRISQDDMCGRLLGDLIRQDARERHVQSQQQKWAAQEVQGGHPGDAETRR
jgi:hypothetical protein